MTTTADLLDKAKDKNRIQSDYALAKKLGLVRQRLSQIRSGRAVGLRDGTAVKIAQLLDVEPGYVMSVIAAEHAHDPAVRAAWERTAEAMSTFRKDRRQKAGQSPTGTERRADCRH